VAHFWPGFRGLLDAVPDTRFRPFITYDKRFLLWWGLLLFGCTLRSRRQLDFDLRDAATQVLGNVNRLAGTQQPALPVHDTLDHFLGHVGAAALAGVRTQMVRRLIRMKALNRARLLGRFVTAVDGTAICGLRGGTAHTVWCSIMPRPTCTCPWWKKRNW